MPSATIHMRKPPRRINSPEIREQLKAKARFRDDVMVHLAGLIRQLGGSCFLYQFFGTAPHRRRVGFGQYAGNASKTDKCLPHLLDRELTSNRGLGAFQCTAKCGSAAVWRPSGKELQNGTLSPVFTQTGVKNDRSCIRSLPS